MIALFRFCFVVMLWVAWPIIVRSQHFPFIFVVVPGTRQDVTGYFPTFLADFLKKCLPITFPVGFLGGGIVMGTLFSAEEMEGSAELSRKLYEKLRIISSRVQAKAVAMAG